MSYAKITPADYADNVALATGGDAGLTPVADLPQIQPMAALESVEHAMECIGSMSISANTPALTKTFEPIASCKPSKSPGRAAATTASSDTTTHTTIKVVGFEEPVKAYVNDSWRMVGSNIVLPNSIWGEEDGSSSCTIAYFIGRHRFSRGGTHAAYVVTLPDDDLLYAVRAETIVRCSDPTTKKRLRKQPQPTALNP